MSQGLKINKKTAYKIARNIKMIVFDFDGVFTDNRVLVFQDGKEGVFCHRSDGLGLKAVRELEITTVVISTEVNPVVSARCQKLNLTCIQGCENKLKALEEEAKRLNISLKEVAYLGNDINDLECLKKVGLAACVSDAHREILKICKYVTKLPGGRGVVREFCDFIIKAKKDI